MTMVTTGMGAALAGLAQAIEAARPAGGDGPGAVALGNWRWTVRRRMAAVRDALVGEAADADDGWLAARGGTSFRERNVLLGRLSELGAPVLENPDVEAVRHELKRLLADITRHVQRVNDLAYDSVEIEFGGSE